MPFESLIAAGRSWHFLSDPDPALAWAALRRLQNSFPAAEQGQSLDGFARQILAIKEQPGQLDEKRVISLLLGGAQVSQNMQRLFEALEGLSEDQKKQLDALQDSYAQSLADFFAGIGVTGIFPGVTPPAPPAPKLTDIKGIGPGTARHLAALGVQELADLATLSDARLSEIEAHIPRSPGRDLVKWRAEAKALLAGG